MDNKHTRYYICTPLQIEKLSFINYEGFETIKEAFMILNSDICKEKEYSIVEKTGCWPSEAISIKIIYTLIKL